MKVIHPSPLLEEAATALAPVRSDVVVIGAAAIEVALHGAPASIARTRDVDVVVGTEQVDEVVKHLEEAELALSEAEHERGFTWIRGDLKVQLIRGFHPFPSAAGRRLPINTTAELARVGAHRETVAFAAAPELPVLWVANAACLVALKQRAFGRTRPPGTAGGEAAGETVRRDFHDVYSLIAHVPDEVKRTYAETEHAELRERVRIAVGRLADEDEAVSLAANEMVALGEADSQREAEARVRRAARTFRDHL